MAETDEEDMLPGLDWDSFIPILDEKQPNIFQLSPSSKFEQDPAGTECMSSPVYGKDSDESFHTCDKRSFGERTDDEDDEDDEASHVQDLPEVHIDIDMNKLEKRQGKLCFGKVSAGSSSPIKSKGSEETIGKISIYSPKKDGLLANASVTLDKLTPDKSILDKSAYCDSWLMNQGGSRRMSDVSSPSKSYNVYNLCLQNKSVRRSSEDSIDAFLSCEQSEPEEWEFQSICGSEAPTASKSAEELASKTDAHNASYQYRISSVSEPNLASPLKDEFIISPVKDESLRSPVKDQEKDQSILGLIKDEFFISPEKDESYKNPVKNRALSPEKDESILGPTKDESLKPPEKDKVIKSPARDQSISSPVKEEATRRPSTDENTRTAAEDEFIKRSKQIAYRNELILKVFARTLVHSAIAEALEEYKKLVKSATPTPEPEVDQRQDRSRQGRAFTDFELRNMVMYWRYRQEGSCIENSTTYASKHDTERSEASLCTNQPQKTIEEYVSKGKSYDINDVVQAESVRPGYMHEPEVYTSPRQIETVTYESGRGIAKGTEEASSHSGTEPEVYAAGRSLQDDLRSEKGESSSRSKSETVNYHGFGELQDGAKRGISAKVKSSNNVHVLSSNKRHTSNNRDSLINDVGHAVKGDGGQVLPESLVHEQCKPGFPDLLEGGKTLEVPEHKLEVQNSSVQKALSPRQRIANDTPSKLPIPVSPRRKQSQKSRDCDPESQGAADQKLPVENINDVNTTYLKSAPASKLPVPVPPSMTRTAEPISSKVIRESKETMLENIAANQPSVYLDSSQEASVPKLQLQNIGSSETKLAPSNTGIVNKTEGSPSIADSVGTDTINLASVFHAGSEELVYPTQIQRGSDTNSKHAVNQVLGANVSPILLNESVYYTKQGSSENNAQSSGYFASENIEGFLPTKVGMDPHKEFLQPTDSFPWKSQSAPTSPRSPRTKISTKGKVSPVSLIPKLVSDSKAKDQHNQRDSMNDSPSSSTRVNPAKIPVLSVTQTFSRQEKPLGEHTKPTATKQRSYSPHLHCHQTDARFFDYSLKHSPRATFTRGEKKRHDCMSNRKQPEATSTPSMSKTAPRPVSLVPLNENRERISPRSLEVTTENIAKECRSSPARKSPRSGYVASIAGKFENK